LPNTPEKNSTMDRAIAQYDSKFRFVLLASTRAEQLLRGARAKIEQGTKKPTRTAMEELRQELLGWDYGPAPAAEPGEGEPEGTTATEE